MDGDENDDMMVLAADKQAGKADLVPTTIDHVESRSGGSEGEYAHAVVKVVVVVGRR